MAPQMSWEEILVISPVELTEAEADNLYSPLIQFKVSEEDNVKHLFHLFCVTQKVLEIKGGEAEVYMDELEKMAEQQGQDSAEREKELLSEIEELKRDILRLEDVKGGDKDVRSLRNDLRDLERQNNLLRQEIQGVERELNAQNRSVEQHIMRAEKAETELRELRLDNEQNKASVLELQLQLETQREAISSKRGDDAEARSKIRAKNKELSEALDEINNLTEANDELQSKCEEMKNKLEDAVREMDKITEDYVAIKSALDNADSKHDHVVQENERLKVQLEDFNKQQREKTEADDAVMIAVNAKVDEWKQILSKKDDEIVECKSEIFHLEERLAAMSIDTDREYISVLTKAVEEKDKLIESLQQQLKDATAEMESNAAALEDLHQQLESKAGSVGTDKQQEKVVALRSSLKKNETLITDLKTRVTLAEADAAEKDKQLTEALTRMRQYESGEYGLAEAVSEIKQHKAQITVRDRQIEELVQHCNKIEVKQSELWEENQHLREKQNLDPSEPLDFHQSLVARKQQDRVLVLALEKELETLEEERINLKKQIRQLVQLAGKRVMELGSTSEGLEVTISHLLKPALKDIRSGKFDSVAVTHTDVFKQQVESKVYQQQIRELEQEITDLKKAITTNKHFEERTHELEEENKNLEQGLREILEALKEHQGQNSKGNVTTILCPTLEKVLSLLEAKLQAEAGNLGSPFKSQADELRGRCEELRNELRLAHNEVLRITTERDNALEKISELQMYKEKMQQKEIYSIKAKFLQLPQDLAASSSDVINNLNEHLIETVNELLLKQRTICDMEEALEESRRKFAVVVHQQGLVYKDFTSSKEHWEQATQQLESRNSELLEKNAIAEIRSAEFDRLLDSLSQDDVEVRRRLAELTRKVTVLQVNESKLSRKYTTMQDLEKVLRKENTKLQSEVLSMETTVMKRLGYLQRHKDMSAYKIRGLQQALERSVPEDELILANKHFTELTEKYRDVLQKVNTLVDKTETTSKLEIELNSLKSDKYSLEKELETAKEKLHALDAALEFLKKGGVEIVQDTLSNETITNLSKQVTLLEMRELNERQRAEHSVRLYEQQKTTLREVEDRNAELEQKFAEISKMNLQYQKEDRRLREELENSVTRAESKADKLRIGKLEESESTLKEEVEKLREIADVASFQRDAKNFAHISRDTELFSIRQLLLDFQSNSDDKSTIAKLHHQLVALQVGEGTAVRKLEHTQNELKKVQAQLLRTEQRLDEREERMFYMGQDSRSKIRYLKKNLHDVRRKFAGAIPLLEQEKFSETFFKLQVDKQKTEEELALALSERCKADSKVAEMDFQQKGLQELIRTLKDGRGATKITEWHAKMEEIRLNELKLTREVSQLRQQILHVTQLKKTAEDGIRNLEKKLVQQASMQDQRQLTWEERELALEENVARLEKQHCLISSAAAEFEEAMGSMPDPDEPVATQLEQAVTTIKRNVKVILESRAKSKELQSKVITLEAKLKEVDDSLISRERIISELRLRLPVTVERERTVTKAKESGKPKFHKSTESESKQGVTIAKETVSSLRERLEQKQDTILKYQELLKDARDEVRQLGLKHEQELKAMHGKLQKQQDHEFQHFKQAAMALINKPGVQAPTNKQVAQVNELKALVEEQEQSIWALKHNLDESNIEINRLKLALEERKLKIEQEKKLTEESSLGSEVAMEQNYDKLQARITEQAEELALVHQQLEEQRAVNMRAPSALLKQTVEKLKNQLILKEKQYDALSKALSDVRADMVRTAEDNIKLHNKGISDDIQTLITKHTQELQSRNNDLEALVDKLNGQLKKYQEAEPKTKDVKIDVSKKDSIIQSLKSEKERLESEVHELKQKFQRLVSQRSVRTVGLDHKNEVAELRRKIERLEQQQQSRQSVKTDFSLWEERKKYEKNIEQLKRKLSLKEVECAEQQKSVSTLKEMVEQNEKEKTVLRNRLRDAQKTDGVPLGTEEKIQELKKQAFQLEEENLNLKRQVSVVAQAGELHQHRLENQLLAEKIEILEKQLEKQAKGTKLSSEVFQEFKEREQKLQRKIISLSEENMNKQFDLEKLNSDIPRLKERVKDLEQYIDVLRNEKEERPDSTRSTSSGGIRKIGTSGKTTIELERTISLMKKVIENLKTENERLKKTSRPMNEKITSLLEQNEKLSSELQQQKEASDLIMSKISSENEKLRLQFDKEKNINEKLRIEMQELSMKERKLQSDLQEVRSAAPVSKAKRSTVAYRMMEDKLQSLEAELSSKLQVLDKCEEEKQQLQEQLTMFRNVASPPSSEAYRSLMLENVDLKSELRDVQLENMKLQREIEHLKLDADSHTPP